MAGISPLSGFSWFVVVAHSMFRDTIFCCRSGCSFMSKGCFCSSQTDECSTVDTSHFGVKYTFHFDDVVISDLPLHPKRCYGHFDSHSTVSKYQRHWRKKKRKKKTSGSILSPVIAPGSVSASGSCATSTSDPLSYLTLHVKE